MDYEEDHELDDYDLKYILEEEEEIKEIRFRWEYAHEAVSDYGSVFKKILPNT